jgi:hydrogenase expression/formation protein HypE
MIGEVRKDKLVVTSGAEVGGLLLLVKGICIEGTAIIAREKETGSQGFERNIKEFHGS